MSTVVTPAIPSGGTLSVSQIKSAFPNVGNSMSSFYGKSPSLPSSGAFSLSTFRGITAPAPSFVAFSTAALAGTNIALSSGGVISGYVASTKMGVMNLNLANYLDSAAYNTSMTYAVAAGTLPSGVTLSTAGVLAHNTSANTSASVSVRATNGFGNYATISISFTLLIPIPVATQISALTLGTGTSTVNLASYFTYATSYAVTSSPYANASVSASTLSIAAAYRNTSYSITVRGTNSSGSVSQTISVTETATPNPYGTRVSVSASLMDQMRVFKSGGNYFQTGRINSSAILDIYVGGNQGDGYCYMQHTGRTPPPYVGEIGTRIAVGSSGAQWIAFNGSFVTMSQTTLASGGVWDIMQDGSLYYFRNVDYNTFMYVSGNAVYLTPYPGGTGFNSV